MYSSVIIAADVSPANEIAAGKAIFDRLCANCHRTPTSIKTSATELQMRLSSGAIRQHRFQLSEDELAQVTEYIKSIRP
jgi:mono/diheme cytochrome c family protein